MDWTTIVATLITGCATVLTTIITNKSLSKREKMHNAKQSIQQMIMEDKLSYGIDKKMPQNYQRIMYEFDIYVQNGGNSYMHEKVDEYKLWYNSINSISKE